MTASSGGERPPSGTCSWTTSFSIAPSPSISTRTRSPGFSHGRPSIAAAIPDGVPVAITSPGSSVHACERISTCRKQSKISWPVLDCWRSSPLT